MTIVSILRRVFCDGWTGSCSVSLERMLKCAVGGIRHVERRDAAFATGRGNLSSMARICCH